MTPVSTCAERALGRLNDAQLAAQLLMVGVDSDGPEQASGVAMISSHAVGNVTLWGTNWSSAARVAAMTTALARLSSSPGAPSILPLMAGNQEGGAAGSFQAFYGPGFDPMPAAITQGTMAVATLGAYSARWGAELRSSGVNLDFAPVMDIVPPSSAATNQAIGIYGREYGGDAVTVQTHADAFIAGLQGAGVAATIKHFPGLGHVTGNTDFTSIGITDTTTTASGADVATFGAGIAHGAQAVMVSSATYTLIDPGNPAVFSPAVMQVLRGRLGFRGVIVSDSLSGAAAVASVTPAQRALRFLFAGGDLVLSVHPSVVPEMLAAVVATMQSSPAFRARARDAALRILNLKQSLGLLTGC